VHSEDVNIEKLKVETVERGKKQETSINMFTFNIGDFCLFGRSTLVDMEKTCQIVSGRTMFLV